MGKITLEKEVKKSAEDANEATQQNKDNTKVAVDPKITIPAEEQGLKKDEINDRSHVLQFFLCIIIIFTFIGGGLLIYMHINFFCTALLDVEGTNYREKYEELQKTYADLQEQYASLNKRHDVLTRRNAVCMTRFVSSLPSLKQMYGEDNVISMMNEFGEAIQPAIIE